MVLLGVLLAWGLSACRVEDPNAYQTPEDKARFEQIVGVRPGVASNVAPPLRLTLDVRKQYRYGLSVPLELVLRNVGDQPVPVTLFGNPPYVEFVASRADGSTVWTAMKGTGLVEFGTDTTLAPGQEWRFKRVWDQRSNRGWPILPGTYYIRGILFTPESEFLFSEVERVKIGIGT